MFGPNWQSTPFTGSLSAEQVLELGEVSRSLTRGWMVLEPDTLHGTIVAAFVQNQQKRFSVIPMTGFRAGTGDGTLGNN